MRSARLSHQLRGTGEHDPAGSMLFGSGARRPDLAPLSHAGDGVVGGVVYFLVDSVDAVHSELTTRNVRIHIAPVDQTWGMREMYVLDPDGNSIRFGCPVTG